MKVRSIKTNYILNALRIVSSTLIGVFTMPYINNALGPESLGKVEYVNSIISYFILFSALGIPVYGIREIAKVRNDKFALGKTLVEILTILIFTSFIAYILLFTILFGSNFFLSYKELIVLMSSMILLNNLGAEWFFQGIEDQLYITIRYIAVRIITVILLFTLIHDTDDYLYYALIVILNLCGSNFSNFFRLRRYITKEHLKLKNIELYKHIKPSLTIFIASISVSIYLQIDTFLLGYLAGDKFVGYYSVANKLLRYVITFIVSIGAVLLPRLSNLWSNDKESYYDYLIKAFNILLLVSIPFSLYFFFFAEDIISLMAGRNFQEAILTLKLLAPVCVLVAMAYFFGYLVLYTQGNEKLYTISVTVSAICSILINYYLINKYQQDGAAITQVFSEFLSVLIIIIFLKNRSIFQLLIKKNIYKIVAANTSMLIICILYFRYVSDTSIYFFVINSLLFGIFYLLILYAAKENTILYGIKYLTKNILKK